MKRNEYIDKAARVLSLLCIVLVLPYDIFAGDAPAAYSNFSCAGGTDRVEIAPGHTRVLHLSLALAEQMVGFQTDLTLPRGLAMVESEGAPDICLAAGCVATAHSIFSAKVSGENRFRIVAFSSQNAAFAGGDDLLAIKVTAASDFAGGDIVVDRTVFDLCDGGAAYPESVSIAVVAVPLPSELTAEMSALPDKLREGGEVRLDARLPACGYTGGWSCQWSMDNVAITTEASSVVKVPMAPGMSKGMATHEFVFSATNRSPEGDLRAQLTEAAPTVTVYRAPQAPAAVVRKGDGSTKVLIALFDIDDAALAEDGYRCAFGYTEATGAMHVVQESERRYARYASSVYDDASLPKWCYAVWTYADGSVVSSGLRYLDGRLDGDFDASTFDGDERLPQGQPEPLRPVIRYSNGKYLVDVDAVDDTRVEIFDNQGRRILCHVVAAGDSQTISIDRCRLVGGLYIVRVATDSESASAKVYLR